MSSSKKVLLKSADGESFEVDEAVALESQTIAHIVEDDCMDDGIPLPNVTGKILAMVITFCKKHVEAGDASKSKAGDASKSEAGDASKSKDAADASTSEAAVASKSEAVDGGDSSDEELKAWDAEFMKIDQPTIFELILAANYLNIPKLLDLTCQTVADMIKDKQPEEIRTIFNIKNDFAPEEEEEVRRENQWAFE